MKLLHLGDLHLGKSLAEFDLYDDQKYILEQILNIIKEEKIDAVLLAGDIYDRAIPSEAATNLLDYFLKSLAEINVNTYLISGNHDSDDRLNFGSSLFESNGIHISSKFNGTMSKYTLSDSFGEVDIYLLPFVKASLVKHYYEDKKIESYEDAINVVIEATDIDETKRNVILAHQFVAGGGKDPELSGSEGPSVQSIGTVEKIGYKCFDAFDYVALGHIHSPQKVGRDEVRYSGSPLKYSLSEVNNKKSVPIITLNEKGSVEIDLVPLKPLRDLRHIKGKMEDLLKAENISGESDFIYVTLTDDNLIDNVMGIFQQYYKNTVKIDYDNSYTRELENFDVASVIEKKSFAELIEEFYRNIYGYEIGEEEMEIMREVAREAGVLE